MELENFSESTKIIVNAAFNYANENKFEFFNSVHLLKILIEKDSQVSETLSYFKVNKTFQLKSVFLASHKWYPQWHKKRDSLGLPSCYNLKLSVLRPI